MSEKTLVIGSESSHLKEIRDQVNRFLIDTGFSDKIREDVLVAIGEACANSMRHAYSSEPGHEIRVTLMDEPDKVIFKVRDYGKKIDLSKLKAPTLPPEKPHGLGVYFMQTIMDSLQYNTQHSEGNEIILTKYKEKNKKGSAS